MATKKTAAKKTVTKKSTTTKAKESVKAKASPKKSVAKKVKKSSVKASKPSASKSSVKKSAVKKASPKKSTAKTSVKKKTEPKKSTVKTNKKAASVKSAVKKALKNANTKKDSTSSVQVGMSNVNFTPSNALETPKLKSDNVKLTSKVKGELPFDVGTYIFYPNDGLGFIESLEKRELEGKTVLYYKIKFPVQKMTSHIPVKNAKLLKLRKVISKSVAQKVLKILATVKPPSELSWKDRLNVYQETNKKGNALEMAAMVASLHLRKQQKNLSFQERQYFEFAQEAVIGEVSVALGLEKTQAQEQVKLALQKLVETQRSMED